MKVMTVSLPCRAHSGLHAGIVRWAQSVLCEFPISPPDPFHGPRCIAGRLRRRGAVLRETPPAPPRGGRGDSWVAYATFKLTAGKSDQRRADRVLLLDRGFKVPGKTCLQFIDCRSDRADGDAVLVEELEFGFGVVNGLA